MRNLKRRCQWGPGTQGHEWSELEREQPAPGSTADAGQHPGPVRPEEAQDLGFSRGLLSFKCWKLIFKNHEKQQGKQHVSVRWSSPTGHLFSELALGERKDILVTWKWHLQSQDLDLGRGSLARALQAIWFGGSMREGSYRAIRQALDVGMQNSTSCSRGPCISVHSMTATEWNEPLHQAAALSCPPRQCEGPGRSRVIPPLLFCCSTD